MNKNHDLSSKNKPHRGNYLYELIGTLRAKKLKRNPQYTQHYYQLLLTCENLPQITKIFVFKSKTTPPIWQTVETGDYFGQRYLLKCRNYQGHYYLVEWKKLAPESPENLNDYDNSK